VALTNSPLEAAREQLRFAGLADLFDDVLSADEVRELKPGPRPCLAAERSSVPSRSRGRTKEIAGLCLGTS
jgi:2-haloacid dehalogenase